MASARALATCGSSSLHLEVELSPKCTALVFSTQSEMRFSLMFDDVVNCFNFPGVSMQVARDLEEQRKQFHTDTSSRLGRNELIVELNANFQRCVLQQVWAATMCNKIPRVATRIKQLIELAGGARSFAPHKSCQFPDFSAVSGHVHQEPAEMTKRLPDIAKLDGTSPNDSLFQRVTFSL